MRGVLKVDHYVETADGTLCRVRYIQPAQDGRPAIAELRPEDGGDSLELPVAELRRVPDPNRRRLEIEGLPARRPRCQACDRKLPFLTRDEYQKEPVFRRIRRVFVKWSGYDDLFCTLTCARAFAYAAHRAGFRVVRRPASSPATKGSTQ